MFASKLVQYAFRGCSPAILRSSTVRSPSAPAALLARPPPSLPSATLPVRCYSFGSWGRKDSDDSQNRVTRNSVVTSEARGGPPVFSGYIWLTAGAVGLSGLSLWISNELLSLSLLTMTELGFLVGGMTASGVAALGFTVQKWFSISPESVHKLTWNRLKADPQIQELLGKSLQTTSFRAYMSRGGIARFNVLGYQVSSRPTLDLLFEVSGPKHKGMAYVVVEKNRSQYIYKELFVHIPSTGQRIVLEGDGKTEILQGVIYF